MLAKQSLLPPKVKSGLDDGENDMFPARNPFSIFRVIRRMRGGSQSQLVQCEDANFYVAKFMGNPQGNRSLINELIAYRLITRLEVTTPKVRLLELPESARQAENVYFEMDSRVVPRQGGVHFGSQCPANPDKTAIFDFLPTRLLPKISNIYEFATMFVLDKWLHHTDKRQAIYLRDQGVSGAVRFKAYFIDHGMILNGEKWELGDAPLHGLAFPPDIYSLVDMRTLTRTAVEAVQAIPPSTVRSATEDVPLAWFGPGDQTKLATLLIDLERRQEALPLLVGRHLNALKL